MTVRRRGHPHRRSPAAWTSLLLGVCLVAAGCSAALDKAGGEAPAGEPVVLTMLNPFDPLESMPFADAVDRLSRGALRIEMRSPEDDARADADVIRAVLDGQAALGLTPARAWHDVGVRSFDALIAPFVVDSLALQQRVLASDLVDDMLVGPDQVGLAGVGILPGPIRHPFGITTELLGPADYEGQRLAISDSAVAARTFRVLHATAEAAPFFGAPVDDFDGLELHLAAVAGNEYDKVAHAFSANVNLWPRPLVIFGNPNALAVLGDSQRQILRQAAREALLPTLELQRETETEELGNLCRRGTVTFLRASAAQLDELRGATRPVLTWLRKDADTDRTLDRIESMRPQVAAAGAAEPAPSCDGITASGQPSPEPASNGAVSLDGVYTMTSRYADAIAAGADPNDMALENYGDWVFVVDGDRFAYTQSNGPACSWGYGSWQVDGQTVRWLFTDGGSIRPNTPKNKPGESFAFGWSIYKDTLTLTALPGALSPDNFYVKPWHRISRTPQAALLGTRCPPPPNALPAH